MKARQARQAARREYTEGRPEKPEEETEVAADHEEWPSWEAVPVEGSDEEADPGQALPHEELELTETNTAAQGAVPEPKYPPKGCVQTAASGAEAEAEGDPARAYASAEAKLSDGGRIGWRGFCNAGTFVYDRRGSF